MREALVVRLDLVLEGLEPGKAREAEGLVQPQVLTVVLALLPAERVENSASSSGSVTCFRAARMLRIKYGSRYGGEARCPR